MNPLRVSRDTDPGRLGNTIALALRDDGRIEVRAMGPGAVNQAVKGLILARQFLAAHALDVDIKPAFSSHVEGETEMSVIVFRCDVRDRDG